VKNVRRPIPAEAAIALTQVEEAQSRLRAEFGVGVVYASDELYLLAGRDELPPAECYDGFPVLSNGVGLLRSMLDDWCALLRRHHAPVPERRVVWLSGRLAAPALERMADAWLAHAGWRPQVQVVHNHLFGDQISVSGLLAGSDLIAALEALPPDVADVVLPRSAFGFDGNYTLDGVSAETVGATHPGRVHLATTPAELLELLTRSG
jgi:NifB/MoaA-like Fe-S oxidoreductase